jgi:hypothetical protein
MSKHLILLWTLCILFSGTVYSQDYFRIEADFTVKVKKSDGKMNLTRGRVYYDKNYKELIYDITFPELEKWVIRDTSIYKIRKDTLTERVSIPSINEFTVFHLSLNSNLNDFGLKNSVYKIGKVEKKGDLVLSYWKIPDQASTFMDHVVIAKKDNRLESLVMVGNESKIVSRQFFKEYIKIDAFEFPGQIIQILYDINNQENYQVTEFKNIRVNDLNHNDLYRYQLPKK